MVGISAASYYSLKTEPHHREDQRPIGPWVRVRFNPPLVHHGKVRLMDMVEILAASYISLKTTSSP